MDINEILKKVKTQPSESFESETIEFKNYSNEKSLHNSKELTEEISAFANNNGGIIIIGVIDSSNINNSKWEDQLNGFEKIDLDTTKERILGRLNPKIDIILQNKTFEEKNYLVIKIPNVNHTLVATSSGKIFLREGKSSVPASSGQIQNLVKNLQSYDWSSEELNLDIYDSLDHVSLEEAKIDFCRRRKISPIDISDTKFLESIGATKNGILNKSGILFLGKTEIILKELGLYEYRFSWKTKSGQLKLNDVWDDNIWNSVKRVKSHFIECNDKIVIAYKGNDYVLHTLDDQAFHEAFLNSIVHRDYSLEGMTSINFQEDELSITNPGTFYGGVNSENISYHEPRHRNKNLAKLLMTFQMVDRAGMGVLRIGLNSLKYGREFPIWREKLENIEIRMAAEYAKSAIFILTQSYITECGITELYIINKLYKKGSININQLNQDLKKIISNPYKSILKALERDEMKKFFDLSANNSGIYIVTNKFGGVALDVKKSFRAASNKEKHITLFKYLKEHDSASNEDIMSLLNYASSSTTSQFLSKLKYVINTGKSRNSRWSLK